MDLHFKDNAGDRTHPVTLIHSLDIIHCPIHNSLAVEERANQSSQDSALVTTLAVATKPMAYPISSKL